MRICCFDDLRIGLIADRPAGPQVVDLTHLVPVGTPATKRATALIAAWDTLGAEIEEALSGGAGVPLSTVVLRAPQPDPGLLLAAPVNYRRHQAEMGGARGVYVDQDIKTIEVYAGFVKSSRSVVGPDKPIRLPSSDRRFDHEAELGVVIGKTARAVSREDALDHVFGYVPLIDVTMRGSEDRSFRKSFDTFTPIGPAIVTADQVGSPADLDLHLTVNGETRQRATTADLIYDVAELIELYSASITLQPGDLIATGTPEGVGPIVAGDIVELSVERVGVLSMLVSGESGSAR